MLSSNDKRGSCYRREDEAHAYSAAVHQKYINAWRREIIIGEIGYDTRALLFADVALRTGKLNFNFNGRSLKGIMRYPTSSYQKSCDDGR